MRRSDHITLARLVRTVALLLAAVPALAQPPDTLRIPPCRLAPLSEKLDVSPNVRWAVHGFDTLALYRAIDSEAMKALAVIGDTIAWEPLADFPHIAIEIAGTADNADNFWRRICTR